MLHGSMAEALRKFSIRLFTAQPHESSQFAICSVRIIINFFKQKCNWIMPSERRLHPTRQKSQEVGPVKVANIWSSIKTKKLENWVERC